MFFSSSNPSSGDSSDLDEIRLVPPEQTGSLRSIGATIRRNSVEFLLVLYLHFVQVSYVEELVRSSSPGSGSSNPHQPEEI